MSVALALGCTVARAAPSNSALVEVTDIDGLSVSPDGRHLVFRTERADLARNSYLLEWHSVDLESGLVHDIGSGGEPIYADPGLLALETPVWAPDQRSVVVRALVDGAVGLWRLGVDGGGASPFVIRDADVESYSASPRGGAVRYVVGPTRAEIRRAEKREYDDGIRIDSSIDLAQNLFRGGSVNGRMASERLVGYWYTRAGLLWRAARQEREVQFATGADVPVGKPKPPGPFTPAASPSALRAANNNGDVAQAAWTGSAGTLTARLADGRTVSCGAAECTSTPISAVAWRPGSSEVLVTFTDRERRVSLDLWDVASNDLRAVTSSRGLFNGERYGRAPCAVSRAAAFCVGASAASPPDVQMIDLATGAKRVLFDPNREFRSAYRPRVEYLDFTIPDGRRGTAVLLLQAAAAGNRLPLYVNYYSCDGFIRGGTGDEWPIPQLLDSGFAAACINAVHSSGPQDSLFEYRTGLAAVEAVVGNLARRGVADRSRVAMGGLSFGSEVALWTAIHSHLLAALSISSADLEPTGYWMSSMPGSDQPSFLRSVWGLGKPDEAPRRWRLMSPALNTGRIRAPVLLQLPEQEARRIPELFARLAASNTPTEFYAYPDEAHIKIQPRHRLSVYDRNLDWFRYWIQDYRDPDPHKAAQYARWDAMRRRWSQATGARARAR